MNEMVPLLYKPSEAYQVSVNSQPTVHKLVPRRYPCDIQTTEIHFLIQIKTSNWIHFFFSTCTLFEKIRIGIYDLLGKFSLYLSIHLHVWNLFKFLHPSQNSVNISVMTLVHLSVMKWGAPQFLKISSQNLNFTKAFYGSSHKSLRNSCTTKRLIIQCTRRFPVFMNSFLGRVFFYAKLSLQTQMM